MTDSQTNRWRAWAPSLSIILCVLALPPLALWPLGFVALVPLLAACRRSSLRAAALSGAAFGGVICAYIFLGAFGYHAGLGLAIAAAGAAVFAAVTAVISRLLRAPPVRGAVLVASTWVGGELVLSALGVPLTYGTLFADAPRLLAPAALGGQHLIAFVWIALQTLVVYVSTDLADRVARHALLASVAGLTVLTLLADRHLASLSTGADLRVAVVQTNHHPSLGLDLAAHNTLERVYSERDELLAMVPDDVDLIVWPETTTTGLAARNDRRRSAATADQLVNGLDLDTGGALYQATFGLNAHGEIISRRGKRVTIPLLESHLSRDDSASPHAQIAGRPGSLICYESAFAKPAQELVRAGAAVLAIATNDAYAGPSYLYRMHLALTPLRAIETGRPVLRAANGGGSAILDARGQLLAKAPSFAPYVMTSGVKLATGVPFFVHTSKMWTVSFMVAAVLAVLMAARGRGGPQLADPRGLLAAAASVGAVALAAQFGLVSATFAKATGFDGLPGRNFSAAFPLAADAYDELQARGAGDPAPALVYGLRSRGVRVDLDEMRRRVVPETAASGAWLEQDLFGFQPQRRRTERTVGARFPWLAQLRNGDVVAVRRVGRNYVEVFSPLQGIARLDMTTWQGLWDGWRIDLVPHARDWDPSP